MPLIYPKEEPFNVIAYINKDPSGGCLILNITSYHIQQQTYLKHPAYSLFFSSGNQNISSFQVLDSVHTDSDNPEQKLSGTT